jgi:hypothetical protein
VVLRRPVAVVLFGEHAVGLISVNVMVLIGVRTMDSIGERVMVLIGVRTMDSIGEHMMVLIVVNTVVMNVRHCHGQQCADDKQLEHSAKFSSNFFL